MSGGPPTPFPQGWASRAHAQLAYAGAIALGGIGAFRAIREAPSLSRITILLLVACLLLGVWPSASEFVQIDRCLDSGGRWNYAGLQCEH